VSNYLLPSEVEFSLLAGRYTADFTDVDER